MHFNIKIARLACDFAIFSHSDPADQIIAATAIHYYANLITSDKKLRDITQLKIIW
jgi:PIN domain nuclease of toxin-antitoxin system